MLIRLCLGLVALGWSVQVCVAHEDPAQLAAEAEQQRVEHLASQAKRDFELHRSLPQSYVMVQQGWSVALQVFPAHAAEQTNEVRFVIMDADHQIGEVEAVSLMRMPSGIKIEMVKRTGYFQGELRLRAQQVTTLMVKLKAKDSTTYFFRFEH